MTAQQTIPLFGGRSLDVSQARNVILAHSGADIIREWQVLAASTTGLARHAAALGHCYAGIAPREQFALYDRPLLVGRGATPAGAIEDLLWQVVTPLLLAE